MVDESIEDARIEILDDLTDTIEVQSFTTSRGPTGDEIRTLVERRSYSGLLQSAMLRGTEGTQVERIASVNKFVAVLPWDAEVDTRDELYVDGFKYAVIGMNANESNRITLNVQCERVT